jgi:putative ABC transport system permease protein
MLRAIGATRRQVAMMVILEGVIIGLLGAAVGVPLGIVWTEILHQLFPDVLTAGVTISLSGVTIAAAGAVIASLVASLLPALAASRLSPLEAMGSMAEVPPSGPPIGWAVLGGLLILIDPIIFFGPVESVLARAGVAAPESVATLLRFYAHFIVGLEGTFIGFFLLAPLLVWTIERSFAPALGKLFRLPTSLLRQQLSSGLWRAAGAGAALMVGLAVLIVMTTQGISMLDGWKIPDKFPDIFLVSFRLGGLAPDQVQTLSETPGISRFPDGKPQLMPIAIAVSGLGNNPLALMGAMLSPNANSTMFFGFPPHVGLEMMELDFRDNDGHSVSRDQQKIYAQRAEEQLAAGRNVIVTEDYRRRNHAKYGDPIAFYSNGTKYEYTICGIVWSPGLDVIVAMFDLERQMDQRTVGMVFGSIDDARRDFGQDHVNLFAANLEIGQDKTKLMDQIRQRQGDLSIKAGDVRQIKDSIDRTFRHLLALVTTVAFAAMAVASMGVTNTIMASIRSRRWQLGVLRAIGLCGGELLRLVLAEAILLGVVGLLLGLGAGAMLTLVDRQLSAGVLGYLPPLVVPWGYIAIGVGTVMIVSVAAALWPAISISRTEPLELLQAGRASA